MLITHHGFDPHMGIVLKVGLNHLCGCLPIRNILYLLLYLLGEELYELVCETLFSAHHFLVTSLWYVNEGANR